MKGAVTGFNPDYATDAPTLEQVSALQGDAILEFGTPWCGHCRAARTAVQEVLGEYPQLLHIKIFDGKGEPLGRGFRVKHWPTLIRLRDGVEVARVVRPVTAEQVRGLLA